MKPLLTKAVLATVLAGALLVASPTPARADTAIPYPNWQELMNALGLGEMWGNFFANFKDWHMPPWEPYHPPQ